MRYVYPINCSVNKLLFSSSGDAAPKSDVLNEINSSGFKPTAFQPSALKEKSAPVMVDLTEKTYAGNPPPKDDEMADSIFHPNVSAIFDASPL